MQLTLDTIEGAEAEIGFESTRWVRTGLVTGIPAAIRSDPFVLARAILEAGGPQLGESHPYGTSQFLRRIVARPAAGTNDAMVQYHYEGPTQGSGSQGAAILVVEDDSTVTTESTCVDLEGKVIQAIYTYRVKVKVGSGDYSLKEKPVPKTVDCPIERPRRSLIVSGLLFGRKAPSAWSRQAIGTVNDAPWPTGSLWADDASDPAGYWMCRNVSATTDRFKFQVFDQKLRPYRVRAVFTSKVRQNWMAFGFFRDFFGNVPKDVNDQAAAIKDIVEKGPYSIKQNHDVNGFVAVGLSHLNSFPSTFGF